MIALALVVPLFLQSPKPEECYLVTNVRIHMIACDFSAAATDALRYAAKDMGEARSKKAEPPQQRTASGPGRIAGPAGPAFGGRRARGDSTR